MGTFDRLKQLNEAAKTKPPEPDKVQKPIAPLPKELGGKGEKKAPKEPQKAITQKEQIEWGCKCRESVAGFLKRKCPGCISKERIKRKKAKEEKHPETAPKTNIKLKGRLPHGSRFDVTYDSARTIWRGILVLPVPPETVEGASAGEPMTVDFHDEASSVFKLLARLDWHYRDWQAKQPTSESEG